MKGANACENKLEFKNQRRKPTLLSAALFAYNRAKYDISRPLLTV